MSEMVRLMMSYLSLASSFWGYAIMTSNGKLNVVPSKAIVKTPHELWIGHEPSLHHFRIWGCVVHVLKKKEVKLEPRTEVCMFVGYPRGTRGGVFYSPPEKKTFVSKNATFLETDYMQNHIPQSKIVLNELLSENDDEIAGSSTRVDDTRV